jgi:hypothetical protein
MTSRTVGLVGAVVAIAAIVVIGFTTAGVPVFVPPIIGVVLLALLAWSLRRAAVVAARVHAVMAGKGAMTITEIIAALGDNAVKRTLVISALARLRTSGKVTREALAEPTDGPDTHRYTATVEA